jgi:chromosome segregation ATPase
MGPDKTGYDFAKIILKSLPMVGILVDSLEELPEIGLVKKNYLSLYAEFSASLIKLLDGFGVQFTQRMRDLDAKILESGNMQTEIESSMATKDHFISDLNSRLESLSKQHGLIVGEKDKADKLIRVLEDQNAEKSANIKTLERIIDQKVQEIKTKFDALNSLENKNRELERKLQEADLKMTVLQNTFEKLKVEERLQSQKHFMERLEEERAKAEEKMAAQRNELKGLYETRVKDLTAELNELKAEAKGRLNKSK